MSLFQINLIGAAIGAIAYAWCAIAFVRVDRQVKTGGFISLNGMVSFLATFPVAVAMDFFGWKFNFRSNGQMAVAIALCAGITFLFFFGVMTLVGYMWNLPPAPAG